MTFLTPNNMGNQPQKGEQTAGKSMTMRHFQNHIQGTKKPNRLRQNNMIHNLPKLDGSQPTAKHISYDPPVTNRTARKTQPVLTGDRSCHIQPVKSLD
ncbi:hypothetical protein N9Z67_03070 [Rhodopirellula sp.]|nr:hypothetical protein [Rhodopirellula sp.]